MKPSSVGVALVVTLSALACGSSQKVEATPFPPSATSAVHFSYDALDKRVISQATLHNRISVIGFLTTYDVHSQAEARFLAILERHHTPRLNVVALMLEAPENRPLVEAFASSLGLRYPIAIADSATIAGEGPFAGLHHVPSIVILDRTAREAWRHVGFVNEVTLEAAVRAVEQTSPPPRLEEDTSADGG